MMRIGRFQLRAETRTRILRILSALLAVLLTVFCVYHFMVGGDGEIATMLVTEDRIETSLFGEAVLFRNEVAVESVRQGLVVPLVSSGAHVSKDLPLATVYEGGAEYRDAYGLLSSHIEALRAAEEKQDVLADLSQLKQEIDTLSYRLIGSLEAGDGETAREVSEALRVLSCRVQALTDADFSLAQIIAALEEERDALLSSLGNATETVTASASGYYYPDADASFALCSSDKIPTLTGAELLSIADSLRNADTSADGAGTLVLSAEWYIAVQTELTAEELSDFTAGETYPVIFPDSDGVRVPMQLVRVMEATAETPAVLILSTLRMPDGFTFERLQNVRVVTGEMEGFSVPKSAVHTLDGMNGVYVLEGSVMCFCRTEILYDLGARYLVKTTDPTPGGEYAGNTYRYVALYDAMIVSGTSLFHGRVLS